MLACVSLMDASSAATRARPSCSSAIGLLVFLLVDLPLGVQAGRRAFLAFLRPEFGLRLVELGPILEQLCLARGQHRLQVVVLDDGEDIALLDLHPLLDVHPLDPARDLGPDHRLVARLEVTRWR